jgi:hypothetical protein
MESLSSHGHVIPNEDGSVTRCGGPAACPDCGSDWCEVFGEFYPEKDPEFVPSPEIHEALKRREPKP